MTYNSVCHDITEILLKVAFKTITQTLTPIKIVFQIVRYYQVCTIDKKEMEVNEHERLFNITPRHTLK
jgi:hypothetical protein